jgi:hypothetical protein
MSLSHTYYIFACNAKFIGDFGKQHLQDMTYIRINSNLIYFYHLRWVAEKIYTDMESDFDALACITMLIDLYL